MASSHSNIRQLPPRLRLVSDNEVPRIASRRRFFSLSLASVDTSPGPDGVLTITAGE